MNPNTTTSSPALTGEKPRFAYVFATALGAGYLKPGPGTWGSVMGLLLAVLSHPLSWFYFTGSAVKFAMGEAPPLLSGTFGTFLLLAPPIIVWVVVAWLGLRTSTQVAHYSNLKDPQIVVIDEVSGVQLTLILALVPMGGPATLLDPSNAAAFALFTGMSILNWKFLLAGFVLFRIFDITKPFPCRRLEKLPAGWGIMADDWMAGIYAAICLRLALQFHLL
ncbi:MAG TPA: phosphatidylglycerophosphatase A [Candidatus Acidoferrum sp.]|nr:phosphatidylglycerophosphatase A [Candidatus Acidoferrum sp.]